MHAVAHSIRDCTGACTTNMLIWSEAKPRRASELEAHPDLTFTTGKDLKRLAEGSGTPLRRSRQQRDSARS